MHLHRLADVAARLDDAPRFRRRDGHGRLVGHHFDHRLVLGDRLPGRHVPCHDLALGPPLADVRKLELEASHAAVSSNTWPSLRWQARFGEPKASTPFRACTEMAY